MTRFPAFLQSTNGSTPSTNGSDPSAKKRRKLRKKWGRKQRKIRERLSAYRASRREERRPRQPRVAVPSFFTLMNLFCGFLALTQVYEGEVVFACQLIVLAGFFDALDGITARLANATSHFGVELDSLSDVVSFGLAPAFLVYAFGLSEFGPLGYIVAALPALCGAVRLARFNVDYDGKKKDYFEGLPIPAQAITLAALILFLDGAAWYSEVRLDYLSILIPVVFVLSGLMVSDVRFDGFPRPTPEYIRSNPRKTAFYGLALVLLPIFQEVALLFVLIGYIGHGVVETVCHVVREVMNTPIDYTAGAEEEKESSA